MLKANANDGRYILEELYEARKYLSMRKYDLALSSLNWVKSHVAETGIPSDQRLNDLLIQAYLGIRKGHIQEDAATNHGIYDSKRHEMRSDSTEPYLSMLLRSPD